MPRLFISHSSKDNLAALAIKQWLGTSGWSDEDVFLDLEDIGAGERWKDALRKANAQCEAVLLLASPDALASPECLAEVRKAEDYGKEIIVVLLHDLGFDDRRLDSYKERQIVDLGAPPQSHLEIVRYRGEQHEVRFNAEALAKVKEYLFKRGIAPDHFAWPPRDKPDAEPFPGLSAFSEDDAGIFFGRDADIIRGLDRLRLLRRNRLPRLLVIQAASGAGKSSYLRAGLWPRLNRDPDFAPIAILRPAQGILTGPEGLGHKLAALLSRPGNPVSRGDIHVELTAPEAKAAASSFAGLMQAIEAQAHQQRRIGDSQARPPALVLAIDQAEELLGADDKAESERFLFLLASLLHQAPATVELFCIFTIRADGAARLCQTLKDLDLDLPETLPLLPLPQTSYRDVILRPLEVLARHGPSITLDPALVDRLVAAAEGADALPLLAFTISHLYREFHTKKSLTLEQYQKIGGVAGSIEMALKQALAKPGEAPAIPASKDEQLVELRALFIPWLASVDPDTGVPTRHVARLEDLKDWGALVERLVKARLLVVDKDSGVDVIEIAHESLLRQWSALTTWLQADAEGLRLLASVERAAAEWQRKQCKREDLAHWGRRLKTARALDKLPHYRAKLDKTPASRPYLQACARAQRRRIGFACAAGFALLAAPVAAVQAQRAIEKYEHGGAVEEARNYKPTAPILAPSTSAASLADGAAFRDCEECPEMVIIPTGSFPMGSPESDRDHARDELPQHDVSIRRIAIGEFDVTFDEWAACVAGGGCKSNPHPSDPGDEDQTRGRRPVVNIKWPHAQEYVLWLSNRTGMHYRLPTEAEWEYAARGKTTSLYYTGDSIEEWSQANFDNVIGRPEPVGSYPKNPFGLYDMAGNVWQWVEDCFHEGYDSPDAPKNGAAWVEADCPLRVLRGGGFYSKEPELRSANRNQYPPTALVHHVGFRVAREL